jgi:23S rRNA G2069 N7-methylase RlmK/C1962 C5-methylase RlmI
LQILRASGAGADHPSLLHVCEGRYLNAVFARVEWGLRAIPFN